MATVSKRRGRYVLDFYDSDGKRCWKTMPKGATKKQATDELREIENRLEKGLYVTRAKIPTFSEVAQTWYEYKRPNVRQSTHKMIGSHLRLHFSEIDELKISKINIAVVEKFISDRQAKGMNILTLRKILVTLNQVMNYAVRHKYIASNPLQSAERPKSQGGVKKPKIRVLTPEEITGLLVAIPDQKHQVLFRLAVMSGARKGELFGLKWSDIDWENRQIRIRRTFNNGAWYRPKSETSNRRIDIGPETMTILKRWRLACPASDLGLVFPSEAGTPLDHWHVTARVFWPALEAAELPRIRFHDLRHTYASLLIAQGENVKYIQTQLGHASPMLTLSTYAHLLSPVNQEAAQGLEKMVFQASGSSLVAGDKKGAVAPTITH